MYKFKISCVGMKGVDILSLTKPIVEDSYKENYLNTIGVSFGITNIFEEDNTLNDETKKITIHMWRMLYDKTVMIGVFPTYIKGSHILLIVFNETSENTLKYMKDLIMVTRKEWGDIPIFLVGNKDFSEQHPEESWNESLIRDFCLEHRCTDLYFLSKEKSESMEDILIDIAEIYSAFYMGLYPNISKGLKYSA